MSFLEFFFSDRSNKNTNFVKQNYCFFLLSFVVRILRRRSLLISQLTFYIYCSLFFHQRFYPFIRIYLIRLILSKQVYTKSVCRFRREAADFHFRPLRFLQWFSSFFIVLFVLKFSFSFCDV